MNERFAKLIIDHLIEHGVRKFCLSPGSRSTPLAYAVAKDERAETLVHFDERGTAFHAYGFAKGAKAPVAVIVTSGTAAANLFPAVMEAFHDNVPLIILTADRPPELRDCGANQATDQVKIFSHHVRWECDLPCPDAALPDNYLGTTIAQAVYRSNHNPKGPVHINCMFREPFFNGSSLLVIPNVTENVGLGPSQSPGAGRSQLACISNTGDVEIAPAAGAFASAQTYVFSHVRYKASTHYESSHTTLSTHSVEQWARKLNNAERGVIVVGSLASCRSIKHIAALAEHLHWPILPDITSSFRCEGIHSNIIPYYDAILKTAPDLKPNFILHLGDKIVSKTLMEWISKSSAQTYALVADHPFRHDPAHCLTHRLQCDPTLFCEQVLPFVQRRASWLDIWKTLSETIENRLDQVIKPLSEPGLFRFLHHYLPAHYAVFLANGMPIRDADQFFFPRFFRGPIFGKRGLSGIDGNIATAIGIAEGVQRPTLAILGDQTALHDINSLAQTLKAKHPTIFCIINNGGGGIFNFLPIAEKKEVFEEFFAGAHAFNFEHAAKMFGLPYHPIQNFSILSRALKEEKSCVLELFTDRAENVLLHKLITEEIKQCISSVSCMVS